MRFFWIVGLVLGTQFWGLQFAQAQEGKDSVVNQLIKEGFANIRYAEADGELIYTIENDSYKLQSTGVIKALQIIQSSLKGDKPCKLVVTKYEVPQIILAYEPHEASTDVVGVNLTDWDVSYEVTETWKKIKSKKRNNSNRFKVDILVYPQLAFKNLIINQIYQYLFNLNPTVEVSLWPGGKLSGMLKIPVKNDGFGSLENKVHPGHITLSHRFLLPGNLRGRVTMGYFNASRYGVDAQLFYPFKDQRWSAEGRIGYLGIGYWDGFHLHYDTRMRVAWSFGASFYWQRFQTQFIVRAQKWLENDQGVKFEMIRHFRYASIGFYAMKATDSAASMNGGFRFQVALPPYKHKRKGYLPRISTSAQMGMIYNAGNEQYYYREYKTEASDNIMEANSFNPLFIKHEMSNF